MKLFPPLIVTILIAAGLVTILIAPGCGQVDPPNEHPQGWELRPPVAGAAPVSASARMQGIYPVGSRIEDTKAPGGFGSCSNFPKILDRQTWGAAGVLSVVAFPDESVAYFNRRGIAVRVINRSRDVVDFRACDSCLLLVAEALDKDGRWQEIESLPEAICGNSFHRVFLEPDQYWEFPARVYTGPIKTKIRFRLDRGVGEPVIHSNEFAGEIASVQLER